ncbi:MAG: aspartate--ammonia ligase [Clostridia bacterium]|nr:aspartate--ammonia ligase [Clostridia bacterium]
MKSFIPDGYKSTLDLHDTQYAIGALKRIFEDRLSGALGLQRVSAPLFVNPDMGINDDLSGVERAVRFDVPYTGKDAVVVHSLAKWKRLALWRYGFRPGEGLYTDMNAIRRDEELDNLHSVYVDQWDWEKVIFKEQRTVEYLKDTVKKICFAVYVTHNDLKAMFPAISTSVPIEPYFITSSELEEMYPDLDRKAREDAVTKEHGLVFLMQIGAPLKDGKPHDGRAPDYDDWSLNGDILYWCDMLGCALEISSMGIRVDESALDRQLTAAGKDDRRSLYFHSLLLEGKLPYTVGGGIGQSRLCMLLLGKAHVGEVQSSIWDKETLAMCENAGVELL